MRRNLNSWLLGGVAVAALLGTIAVFSSGPDSNRGARSGALAAPTATSAVSSCVAALTKSADPRSLPLGEQVQVSLAISLTCAARLKPVDLVILADDSHSMAKVAEDMSTPIGGGGTPGPIATGAPTEPGLSGDEPAWCSDDGGGGLDATPTPLTRPPRRGTPTPDVSEPTAEPEDGGREDLIKAEKSFVTNFVALDVIERDLASDRLRVGFVSFNSVTRNKQALTNQVSRITSAAARLRGTDITRINVGMRDAEKTFAGSGARVELGDAGREQVLMVLSDFNFCKKDIRAGAIDKAIAVISVGFGRQYNRKVARDFASDGKLALDQSDLNQVDRLYSEVLAKPIPVSVSDLRAQDQLSDNMDLLPDSVQPPTVTVTGQLLEWQLDPLRLPWSLGYRVRPAAAGAWPISNAARIAWTDSEGRIGSAMFPDVDVEVIPETPTPEPTATQPPTPTATATPTQPPTPTATATFTPAPRYMPIAYRSWPEAVPTRCVPEQQTTDTALILDTSTSMSGPTQSGGLAKLDAAIAAAIEIVQLLKPGDQATVIWFNASAGKAADLTGDKVALIAALRGLPATQGTGTAIDQGLQAGFAELQSARHRPGNSRSVILVTDGAQTSGSEQAVREAAAAIRAAGIRIVTVGLGPDVDSALLIEIASAPNLYFPSPTAEGLTQIYRAIAKLIPCP